MGMQSYGNCELVVNMNKIAEDKNFGKIIARMNELFDELGEYFITMSEYVQGDYENDELKQLTKDLISGVEQKLGIDIYPTYIDSDAEGTDNAGELIWCIEPELTEVVKLYADKWTTWSTFS